MSNKIALVSGGTSGIGLSIVKSLVRKDYEVYFIGTRKNVGEKIEEDLSRFTKRKVKFIQLDLTDLNKVQRLSRNFQYEHKRLDLLVHIAGSLFPERTLTSDGIDVNLAIGYLAPFIMTKNLSDLLKQTKNARIISVAANPKTVLKERLNFDTFNSSPKYSATNASLTAVHAKTVMTQFFSQELKSSGVIVNSFDPGFVKSSLTRNMPALFRMVSNMIYAFAPTESRVGIKATTSPNYAGMTGTLITNSTAIPIEFRAEYVDQLIRKTKQILDQVLTD